MTIPCPVCGGHRDDRLGCPGCNGAGRVTVSDRADPPPDWRVTEHAFSGPAGRCCVSCGKPEADPIHRFTANV